MRKCTKPQATKTYLQQLTDIAKRAHAWAVILPLSSAAELGNHQRVTYHPAVRF